ncbi:MAG: amino acid ABC transporter permease [Acidobacteriaceae bacterium]|nr:amino acid ABC transporter permease [Acidobacteriaceae bacterium]
MKSMWDFSVIVQYAPLLAGAFARTIILTCWVILVGTIGGTVLALLQMSPFAPLRWAARGAVETLLAMPALVLMVWLYYCLPMILGSGRVALTGMEAAVAALGMSLAAFVALSARAGIQSIPYGQVEAAYCCGLSRWATLRAVIFPQAWRRAWPAIVAQYITAYKFSTIASVVAVDELLHAGSDVIAQTYRPLEVYTAIAFCFCITTIPLNALLRRVETRMAWAGGIAVL